MRLDGWTYLRTRARFGRIQTKSIMLGGGAMTINVRTAPTGGARVAILDYQTMEPTPHYGLDDCVEVYGDGVTGLVRWLERDNLDELKERPVIIEVQVREGELYALRFPYRMPDFTYTPDGPALVT